MDGAGAVMPGDTIYLQAHTGKMIDIEDELVQARWLDRGLWQTLTIEKASARRLTMDVSELSTFASITGTAAGVVAALMALVPFVLCVARLRCQTTGLSKLVCVYKVLPSADLATTVSVN